MDYVEQHPNKPWDWYEISRNPDLTTMGYLENHPDKPWDSHGIGLNPNLTAEFVDKHLNNLWWD